MFIDQKEPIQVEKASNDSFLKTFNLTKRTLMYHCAQIIEFKKLKDSEVLSSDFPGLRNLSSLIDLSSLCNLTGLNSL